MFEIKKATRENVKLKVGFFGPSGSGKTMSALKFAKGLVGDFSKICVIDTENESASLYSHLGKYNVLNLKAPFNPQRYIQAINFIKKELKDIECLIIDSISHEWDGEGGCLEIHTSLGGQFQHWSKITPLHNKFIQTILQAPFHVLVTARSKTDYAMEENDKGKKEINKKGLKNVTKEGLDYEMTLAFKIEHGTHFATIDKDRTNLFIDSMPFIINEEIGEKVKEWNNSGAEVKKEEKEEKEENTAIVEDIKEMLSYLTGNFTNKYTLDKYIYELGIKTFKDIQKMDKENLNKIQEYLKECIDKRDNTNIQ